MVILKKMFTSLITTYSSNNFLKPTEGQLLEEGGVVLDKVCIHM